MRRRYIFFDIDGTLKAGGYDNAYIPDSTRRAIELLRAQGHFLAIATGRSEAMARGYMQELGFENMVSDGGYGITIEGKLLGITPLNRDLIVELIDECRKYDMPWALQYDNSDTRQAPDARFEEFTHDVYMKTRIEPGLNPRNYENIYKAYVACYAPDEQRLTTLQRLPWCRFLDEYIFVEPADKSYGVRKILDHFGARYDDAIVFGDGINDLSMFVDDWTKVAMGNACDELKACADLITTDVDKDGIWNACKSLGLI
jgi:Cof subfamily protein (haloacid dehalogenase superfamily)